MAATDVHMRQINHFLTLVECGSFGRACQKAHISQPALSKSIRQLEERLQVRLIDRTPQGVVPTTYGEAFVDYAKAIRSELHNALNYMDMLKGVRTGSVAVGAGPNVASRILPLAVAKLTAAHPGIFVSILEGMGESLPRALLCGELDIVVGGKLEGNESDLLIRQKLYLDECVVLCRAGHELVTRKINGLEDLEGSEWILTEKGDGVNERLKELYNRKNLEPPRPAILANSVSFIRTMLCKTDYLGFLPKMMLQDDIDAGRLKIISHPDAIWTGWVYVHYRKRRSLSPLARSLVQCLQQISEDFGQAT